MHDQADLLIALHDGELSEADRTRAKALLAEDPGAMRFYQQLEEADRAFAMEADALLKEPVPERLVDAIKAPQATAGGDNVLQFPRRRAVVSLALAAGLATILITGPQRILTPSEPSARETALAALLQATLESTASGDIRGSGDGALQVSPIVTYQSAETGFCREYLAMDGEAEYAGIACRSAAGSWDIVTQGEISGGEEGGYQAASGEDLEVDLTMGDARALSYDEEQKAIATRWIDTER